MGKPLPENEFYDINKFPAEEGLILFPISMSRITTGQDPAACMRYIHELSPTKVQTPLIGLNFIYTDLLYMNSREPASLLKEKFMFQVINHKNAMRKLLHKNRQDFQIQNAFYFQSWGQLYAGSKDLGSQLRELRDIYKGDEQFQKYLQQDAVHDGKELNEDTVNFYLEEHLLLYLVLKGEIEIYNPYIENRQKWILDCYPGKPPKALAYLFQENPFDLQSANSYDAAQYDLEGRKLYEFDRMNLERWDYN